MLSDPVTSLRETVEAPLVHGGRLRQAAKRYGIPLADWLDVSTGINPHGWPVPEVPPECWARLPEPEDGLLEAAQAYYGASHVLPLAGSQAAIQALPRLRPPGRVGILHPTYAEHARAWIRAGHEVVPIAIDALPGAIQSLDVLVIVNPNNPTGDRLPPEVLLAWHKLLAARDGWLVVDEAFMDATPESTLAPFTDLPRLVVLRSLGKFFGLAGARLGFALAEPELLARLDDTLGPWPVPGPSRYIVRQALEDWRWQARTRADLSEASKRLARLLEAYGLPPTGATLLFQWVVTPQAVAIHDALARLGILTRLFDHSSSLRFGLPGEKEDWHRLEDALQRALN